MRLHKLLSLLLLASCDYPRAPATPRSPAVQFAAVVAVDSGCGDDHVDWRGPRGGTGVLVDGRHVVTADHVVWCPLIPDVHVTVNGRRLRYAVVREDADDDIALLEIASADDLGAVPPPRTAVAREGTRCIATLRGRVCGLAHGMTIETATRLGDSGSGVYASDGRLVGLVVAGDGRTTTMTAIGSWLDGL